MFKKILVANRGEIACRVLRTAKRLGIPTVAVYSEADKDALHRLSADESVCIGPAPSTESYLAIDRIIAACKESGADAVHPGYGFLAENPIFCERLDASGVVFIGPGVDAIRRMGDKITSKKLAREAGVNTIPGFDAAIKDADEAVRVAREVGYPIMLKASAGGGGKGMRVAFTEDECREGFARATSESASAFGDARVFLEKYIEHPRHIEIQVLADRFGNVIHLGERECSLQRRHQKVVEEAPSPFLDDEIRAAMGEQAVALARAVNYESAGTVEFIFDQDGNFYFLEMNTRLQVEHPVTEMITGLDLVELMVRIAAGEKLPLSQSDVQFRGWSIEARVYAEDPSRNFLPSIGRVVRYLPPAESESVRVDTGVFEGGEVSMYYDPLIAKVVTHGKDREAATTAMTAALNEFCIRGPSHNIRFLASLIDHPHFRAGRLSTDMIAQEYPDGFHPANVALDNPSQLIAVAAVVHRRYSDRAASVSGQLPGHERIVQDDWVVVLNGNRHHVMVKPEGISHRVVYNGSEDFLHSDWRFGEPIFRGTLNGEPVCIQVERLDIVYRLSYGASQVDVMVLTPRAAKLLQFMPIKQPPDASSFLLSPMPGLLSQLLVQPGVAVKIGQRLAVVEAMKMENVLFAERDGVVGKLLAAEGDSLTADQPILEFE